MYVTAYAWQFWLSLWFKTNSKVDVGSKYVPYSFMDLASMEILPFKYTQSVGLELHSDTPTVNPVGAMSELYVQSPLS